MSNRTLGIDERLYRYMLSTSLREPPILQALRKETAQLPEHNMQIAPEQGQFMSFLVRLLGVKRILEIGTFTGYSALAMGLALPEDGQLVACDVSPEWTSIAQRYWQEAGLHHKIQLRLGPALRTLEEFEDEAFDLAFVDADKENYPNYFEKLLSLVKPGGLILFDNVLWNGAVADPVFQDGATVAIRELNALVHNDERVDLVMIPLADGLTLLRRR